MKTSVKVNLGSGKDYKKDYINIDNLSECPGVRVDKKHNLDKYPYPFKSNSVDEVYCNHVLEHVKEPDKTLREINRILKKGGILILNVPYFSRGYTVHVHWHGFSIWSVLTDTKEFFKPLKVELKWDDPNSFSKMGFILKDFCKFWNMFLNINHFFSERFLAYKFGGINEVRFKLQKI